MSEKQETLERITAAMTGAHKTLGLIIEWSHPINAECEPDVLEAVELCTIAARDLHCMHGRALATGSYAPAWLVMQCERIELALTLLSELKTRHHDSAPLMIA